MRGLQRLKAAPAVLAVIGAILFPRPAAADHQCAAWKDTNLDFVVDYSASMAGWRADLAESFATQIFNDLNNAGNLTRVGWVGFPQPLAEVPLGTSSHNAVLDALRDTPSNRSEGSPYFAIQAAANDIAAIPTSQHNVLIVVIDAEDWGQWDPNGSQYHNATVALSANGARNYIVYAGADDNSAGALDAKFLAQDGNGTVHYAASSSAVPDLLRQVRDEACISRLPHKPTAAFSILRPEGGSFVTDSDLLLGIEGFALVFDASASSDSEDASTDLHYAWLLTRADGTTLRFSGFGVAAMTPQFQFSDEWLPAGTGHTVTLQVTDTDDNVSAEVSRNFTVTGSPPNIALEGAVDVDVGDYQFIYVRNEGAPASDADIDGGPVTHVLEVLQAPPGGSPAQGASAADGAIERVTTQGDIGEWVIRAVATDNEGDVDTETASFVVRNKPLMLSLAGTEQVKVGETLQIDSSLLDDPDNPNGGGLTFDWQVIQAPVGADFGLQTLLANAPSISFSTTDSEAGTYIFRLTVTDDEPAPWTEPGPTSSD